MPQIDLWSNHESRILEIMALALKLLLAEPDLPASEDSLNRKLFFCIHRANRQLVDAKKHLDWPLTYESRNQPDIDDVTRGSRENKRPDFMWGIYDHLEPDPNKSAKYYVMECKRLGQPSSPSFVFNINYVKDGISRFVTAAWGYGKSCRSGMMIGYIQSMEPEDILSEVNRRLVVDSLSPVQISGKAFLAADVNRLDHQLVRPEIHPSPFDLRHLWIDLREHHNSLDSNRGQDSEQKKSSK
jgi:hypothetical protein